MKETAQCLHCKKEFAITQYGWRIPCPHCARRLNIIPDPQIFVYVEGKPIGIALVGDESPSLAVFSQFFSRILALRKLI